MASFIQIILLRLFQTVHINICLRPFVERIVRRTVLLMTLNPFPVNLDWQPTDFCLDIRKEIIVWLGRGQRPIFRSRKHCLFTVHTNGNQSRVNVVNRAYCCYSRKRARYPRAFTAIGALLLAVTRDRITADNAVGIGSLGMKHN
jgi:hypothetical protein